MNEDSFATRTEEDGDAEWDGITSWADAVEPEGGEDAAGPGLSPDPDQAGEDQPAQAEPGRTDAEEQPAEPKPARTEEPAQAQATTGAGEEERFELVHLGESRSAGRAEVIALAQKGLDYDRIRRERDELKPRMKEYEGFLDELAAGSQLSREELIARTRAAILQRSEAAQGRKLSIEEALERTRKDPGATAPAGQDSETDKAAEAESARRQESFRRFAQAFPQVQAKDIPPEVWQGVRAGGDLAGLYAQHENRLLRERIAALEQNERNRVRSAGSRQSAGTKSGAPTLEELWNNDD